MYNGWLLSEDDREKLLAIFVPKFPEVIAHHVTLSFGKDFIPDPVTAQIVGYACNPDGVECFVVTLDGTSERPNGGTFHITWSIDRAAGFKPVHSNNLLIEGFEKIEPIDIMLTPFAKGDE